MQYFGGKIVNVIMRGVKGSQTLPDGTIVEGNVILEGELLDEDDLHYFLGKDGDVTESLDKVDVIRVFLPGEKYDEFIVDVDDDGGRH